MKLFLCNSGCQLWKTIELCWQSLHVFIEFSLVNGWKQGNNTYFVFRFDWCLIDMNQIIWNWNFTHCFQSAPRRDMCCIKWAKYQTQIDGAFSQMIPENNGYSPSIMQRYFIHSDYPHLETVEKNFFVNALGGCSQNEMKFNATTATSVSTLSHWLMWV